MADNFTSFDDLKKKINELKDGEILKFKISVNASAKSNSIEFLEEFIKIRIKEKAIEGKANKAIIEYLSELFKISKRRIEITSGLTSKLKTVQIKAN